MMLIPVIRMLATASRCVNRDAPSMAPKNSASAERCFRLARASVSSISPELRSASIDICLPGRASKREARGHFGNANRAMIDDHILDGDQNQEDYRADNVVASDHKTAEGLDHVAGRGGAGISVQQNEPRRRNVQCEPE